MPATSIGAHEAETKLSELLDRAHAGEEFLVTRDGKPLARIVPAVGARPDRRDEILDEIRAGRDALADDWRRRGIVAPTWDDLKQDADSDWGRHIP